LRPELPLRHDCDPERGPGGTSRTPKRLQLMFRCTPYQVALFVVPRYEFVTKGAGAARG